MAAVVVATGIEAGAQAVDRPGGRARAWLRRAAPVVVLLAGAALAGAGWQVRAGADRADLTGTDPAAQARVTTQVEAVLGRAFSYSADQDETARTAAGAGFAGRAEEQYRRLSGQLRGWTTEQRMSLTSRAVATGVIRLTADRAELLVLLDQSARRADGPPTLTGAQLRVTATAVDGRWVITDLMSL
ncbi:hypothetical protein ACIRBX_32715 [Kitasatospora sp. NPDC096147]|uniref:hypothetical protein n=1 Tax=Kitasatospora sp. NPDC096147 TaxID=3364093 RepID=UPI0037F14B6F